MWLGIESSKYLFFINGLMDSSEDIIPFSKNNFSTFLMHLFLVQNIFTDELTWNGPSWSISSNFIHIFCLECY